MQSCRGGEVSLWRRREGRGRGKRCSREEERLAPISRWLGEGGGRRRSIDSSSKGAGQGQDWIHLTKTRIIARTRNRNRNSMRARTRTRKKTWRNDKKIKTKRRKIIRS